MAISAPLTAKAGVTARRHQNVSIGRYQALKVALAPGGVEDYPRICRLLPPMRRHHELRTHHFFEC
jgi:hypothetical protein